MSVTVVGGDFFGGIEKTYMQWGSQSLYIFSDGNPRKRNSFPRETAFVLVLTDYVNHNTAQTVKTLAKSRKIPLVFAKRSWRSVKGKLQASSLI